VQLVQYGTVEYRPGGDDFVRAPAPGFLVAYEEARFYGGDFASSPDYQRTTYLQVLTASLIDSYFSERPVEAFWQRIQRAEPTAVDIADYIGDRLWAPVVAKEIAPEGALMSLMVNAFVRDGFDERRAADRYRRHARLLARDHQHELNAAYEQLEARALQSYLQLPLPLPAKSRAWRSADAELLRSVYERIYPLLEAEARQRGFDPVQLFPAP
jgi:hypothetical protein